MESPYVIAWDNARGKLIPLAHRQCATAPRYAIHRSLGENFDYGGSCCGICRTRLMNSQQSRLGTTVGNHSAEPRRHPTKPRADRSTVSADAGTIAIIRDVQWNIALAHCACIERNSRFQVVRPVPADVPLRSICELCGGPLSDGPMNSPAGSGAKPRRSN